VGYLETQCKHSNRANSKAPWAKVFPQPIFFPETQLGAGGLFGAGQQQQAQGQGMFGQPQQQAGGAGLFGQQPQQQQQGAGAGLFGQTQQPGGQPGMSGFAQQAQQGTNGVISKFSPINKK
jgi:hypothetical protein